MTKTLPTTLEGASEAGRGQAEAATACPVIMTSLRPRLQTPLYFPVGSLLVQIMASS